MDSGAKVKGCVTDDLHDGAGNGCEESMVGLVCRHAPATAHFGGSTLRGGMDRGEAAPAWVGTLLVTGVAVR